MRSGNTCRRLLAVCVVVALGASVTALQPACAFGADRFQSGLDEFGGIRTWLVSQGFELAAGADFEEDLLKDFGGEAALRPDGLVTRANGRQIDWQVVFGATPLIRPSKSIPQARTVYYLFAVVTPAASGQYTLTCKYWSEAIVWVNGRQVINGKRGWGISFSVADTEIEMERGQAYHVLVKLCSSLGQAYALVSLTDPGGGAAEPGRPADAACSLPVPGDQRSLVSYLPESLDIRMENYRFFEPDRTARLLVGTSSYRALPPGLNSNMTAQAKITTREGKELKTFKLGRVTPRMLEEGTLSFSFRPSEADASAFYVVGIDLYHEGGFAGRFERTFYCIKGVYKLGEEVGERAKRFYKERDEEEIYTDKDLAYLLLKLEELKLLYDTERNEPDFGERALEFVLDAQRRVEIMERRIEVRPTPGLHEFAYISRVDDSAQPYFIYVPLSYNPMRGAPLIVYLHGYAPELNKINWQFINEGLKGLCEKYGYLLVAPFARSNTDFQGIGEQDVMQVTDLMMTQFGFNIHRDRVFLLGYSMGGMGAYTIAAHYPDRWAGVVSLAGKADFYLWKNVRPEDLQPFKRWLIGLEFADNVAENFRHVPVIAFQGEHDSLVKVAQSKNFIAKLKEMDYDAMFLPVRGEDHWIARPVFSSDAVFTWMEKHRRPETVRKITFATYSLKYNRAYWATIDDFRKWGSRARIDVEVTGDNEFTVEETNVAAFSLSPPAEVFDPARPLAVKVGEKRFTFDAPIKGPLKVVLEPARRTPLRKTPILCGPIKDVYNSRFIFVYGTRANPVENKLLYDKAEKAVTEWREFVKSVQLMEKEKDPLMVRDRDVTDEQKRECNLVLLGTPRTNSVLAEIADRLPIKFEGDTTFVVGESKYSGADLGLNMIYPSPFSAGRYVVVKSGLYYGSNLSGNHKFDMLPDFIIYSKALDYEIPGFYDGKPNHSLCAGFFDKYWQLSDDLMWTQEPAGDREEGLPWWR